MDAKPKHVSLACSASLLVLAVLAPASIPEGEVGRTSLFSFPDPFGAAHAQEPPDPEDDDDDEADDDDPGGDGGDDDPGNDMGDDDAGDDAGDDMGDDAGDDAGDDMGDDAGGDDSGGNDSGGDDDGGDDGGDDAPGAGGGASDDDDDGGDDDGGQSSTGGSGAAGGGDDDDDDDDAPPTTGGGSAGSGAGGDDDDDDNDDGPRRGGGSRGGDDDDAPGGSGVRAVDTAPGVRVRDGDDDSRAPSALPPGVDVDFEGQWIRAGEILAIENDPTSLEFARELGFGVIERHSLTTLGLSIVELRIPAGRTTMEALTEIRQRDPVTPYDFNHLYFGAREPAPQTPRAKPPAKPAAKKPPAQPARAAPPARPPSLTVGIIDTAVNSSHPELKGLRIQQVNLAGNGAPTDHGTAVASIVADGGDADSQVLAAGVVQKSLERQSDLASAETLVRALDWMAQQKAPVVNFSLAGPHNALLKDAVNRAQARGMIVVAAVGNDGPAAPPLFPAAYEGVIGVTAVDESGGIYRRAGRGDHVDIAARGVDVLVAGPDGKRVAASGTSYAAPVVAAALARDHKQADPATAPGAIDKLLKRARDLGARGQDPVYGAGVYNEEGAK